MPLTWKAPTEVRRYRSAADVESEMTESELLIGILHSTRRTAQTVRAILWLLVASMVLGAVAIVVIAASSS